MDIEKYTNSKIYFIFEWGFKLIIWNLLSLLIICLFASIPFGCFFYIQDNYSIKNITIENEEILEDNSKQEILICEQKNGLITKIGLRKIYGEITNIQEEDNKIYFNVGDIIIKVNNQDNIRNIEKIEFNGSDLIITTFNKIYNLGNIYDSEIDLESSYLDGYQNIIVTYDNGVFVNYGEKLETRKTLCGILVIIGLILALFAFISCFITIFSMIKIFSEDGSAETFTLYFNRLWDNFKNIYKLELVLIPLIVLFSYGLYSYYLVISSESSGESISFLYTISYNMLLICLIGIILFILNLPMSLGYFRMKSKTIFKFTVSMTFKNILYSLLYVVIMAVPILLCFLNRLFIPIWFLVGLSLPLVIMYFVSSKKYHYLVNNFNNNPNRLTDEKNIQEIYEFEKKE